MEETRNAPFSNGEDRISRLPDGPIHHILSFLDAKYAVQSSVLSKRWTHTWKSLPFLNFDRTSFPEDEEYDERFVYFVDMVFIFHDDSDIQRFNLCWHSFRYDDIMTRHVNRWMAQAVKHNVQEMTITNTDRHLPYEIPHHLLNCKSLTNLKMQMYRVLEYVHTTLPRSICLPRLKFLWLGGFSIANVELSKRLFSSCPVLETLVIANSDIQTGDQRNLIVDSLSLKKLSYFNPYVQLLPHNNTMPTTIKLCAPNLEEFNCYSSMTQYWYLENSSPLSRVDFDIILNAMEDETAEAYFKLPSAEKDVYAKRMMKYLGAVYMVEQMKLSAGFLEVLSQALDISECQPPRLCNLHSLGLHMWFTRGCLRSMAYLLNISPKINSIFITANESNLAVVGDDWESGLSSPGMLSHLEYVSIEEVEGCVAELKLLSFLLKNAKVLKKLVLHPRSAIDSPDSVLKQFKSRLRALPRASPHIIMHWPATKSTHLI